jgi:hypothetical protein
MWCSALVLASAALFFVRSTHAKQLACDNNIPVPEYFGTKVTNLEAKGIHDWQAWTPFIERAGISFDRTPISFCNVTLTYTHPGQGDTVHVYIWLPLEAWNGNFLGQGGGGWAAGNPGTELSLLL